MRGEAKHNRVKMSIKTKHAQQEPRFTAHARQAMGPHPIDAPMLTTINLIQSIKLSHASYTWSYFFLVEIPLCLAETYKFFNILFSFLSGFVRRMIKFMIRGRKLFQSHHKCRVIILYKSGSICAFPWFYYSFCSSTIQEFFFLSSQYWTIKSSFIDVIP